MPAQTASKQPGGLYLALGAAGALLHYMTNEAGVVLLLHSLRVVVGGFVSQMLLDQVSQPWGPYSPHPSHEGGGRVAVVPLPTHHMAGGQPTFVLLMPPTHDRQAASLSHPDPGP